MAHRRIAIAICLAVCAGPLVSIASEREVMTIDAGRSRVVIHVGKAGVFGVAGHAHEVVAPATGSVRLDVADFGRTEVLLEFESASLRVTGRGEPAEDVPEVQRVMLSDRVLDANRYRTIVFRSRRVTPTGAPAQPARFVLEGELTLHGVTRPCVVPVRATLTEDSLTVEGATTIKQTDFGIQPVTAAGGTVRVKDQLEISFTVRAARER